MDGNDEAGRRRGLRAAIGVCLAVVGPLGVLAAYFLIFASRTTATDYAALGLAAIVSAAGIAVLPIAQWARLVLAAGYLVLMLLLGPVLAIGLACAVAGACL